MTRRLIPIALVAVVCVALIVVAVMVIGMLVGRAQTTPQVEQANIASVTPEEVTVTATAQPDGTLAVTETLVFDTPEGSSDPVSWYAGASRIGWESKARDAQLIVLPTVSDVAGVMLTDDGPGEPLAVQKDDSAVDDPMYDNVVYRFAPDGGEWAPGRHAVQISYLLDDVHVTVGGDDLMILPLTFAHGPDRAVSYRRVDVGEGNAPVCLMDNITFEPDADCSALTRRGGAVADSQLSWEHDVSGPVEAIAFAAPAAVTAPPSDVIRKEVP